MKNYNLFVKVFVLSIVLCTALNTYAQDMIIKKDNEVIKAKILEVGNTEIKYKLFDAPDGPTLTINKREVKTMKIHSENGKGDKVMNIEDDPMSIGNAAIVDKTSSLKFHFFSPLSHKFAFTYEWMVRPGFNWEAGCGIVGIGVGLLDPIFEAGGVTRNPGGFYIRTGPKFLLGSSSDIEIEGGRYAHPLKGKYFKIEAIVYGLADNYHYTDPTDPSQFADYEKRYYGMALNLIYGRQFIFGNSITVGYYGGIGYGFESTTTIASVNNKIVNNNIDTDVNIPFRYSHSFWGKKFPITLTAGFTIGYIFKTPEWISRIGRKPSNINYKAPSRRSMEQ